MRCSDGRDASHRRGSRYTNIIVKFTANLRSPRNRNLVAERTAAHALKKLRKRPRAGKQMHTMLGILWTAERVDISRGERLSQAVVFG
jgi:hypothetical protein